MQHTRLPDAALDYLSRGLSVIALAGKAPNGVVHRKGLHEPFTPDGEHPPGWDLERAFTLSTVTGIGILTGLPYYVVDVDGEEGALQLRDDILGGDESLGNPSWVAKTGRGLHLYFHDIGGPAHPTVKLGPKLDFKGLGGYVAAPPSMHPDGHLYEWLLEPDFMPAVTQIPEAIELMLADRAFDLQRKLDSKQANRRRGPFGLVNGVFHPGRSFEGVFKAMREAGEGNRNAVLYWAAYTLEDDAAESEDFDTLHEAAIGAGLTRRETRLTIRSARAKAGAGE